MLSATSAPVIRPSIKNLTKAGENDAVSQGTSSEDTGISTESNDIQPASTAEDAAVSSGISGTEPESVAPRSDSLTNSLSDSLSNSQSDLQPQEGTAFDQTGLFLARRKIHEQLKSSDQLPASKSEFRRGTPVPHRAYTDQLIDKEIDRFIAELKPPLTKELAQQFKTSKVLLLNQPPIKACLLHGVLKPARAVRSTTAEIENLLHPAINKYLNNHRITLSQALHPTPVHKQVLSMAGLQKYLDSGKLSSELALKITPENAELLDDSGIQQLLDSTKEGEAISIPTMFAQGNSPKNLTSPTIQKLIFSGKISPQQALRLSADQLTLINDNYAAGLHLENQTGNVLEYIAIQELLSTGKNTQVNTQYLSTHQKTVFSDSNVKQLVDAGTVTIESVAKHAAELDRAKLSLLSDPCIKHELQTGKLTFGQFSEIDFEECERLKQPLIMGHIMAGHTSVSEVTHLNYHDYQMLLSDIVKMRKSETTTQ